MKKVKSHYSRVRVRIGNKLGLHLRPCGTIVEEAMKYNADIYITCNNLDREVRGLRLGGKYYASAKSISQLLLLGAGYGTTLEIIAKGKGSKKALKSIEKLVKAGFGED